MTYMESPNRCWEATLLSRSSLDTFSQFMSGNPRSTAAWLGIILYFVNFAVSYNESFFVGNSYLYLFLMHSLPFWHAQQQIDTRYIRKIAKKVADGVWQV